MQESSVEVQMCDKGHFNEFNELDSKLSRMVRVNGKREGMHVVLLAFFFFFLGYVLNAPGFLFSSVVFIFL